jgi:flagellar M-ring protein FliF
MEDAVPVVADKLDPEKVEGEMIKEKITSMIEGNPQKAALIIRDWLHEPASKKEGGKDDATATA